MSPISKAILERALKTFAQVLVATIGADQFDLFSVSFLNALQLAASATVLSLLTSFVSVRVGQNGPSLATEKVEPTLVAGH
jgi:flagellar biosynthesis protein FlhB